VVSKPKNKYQKWVEKEGKWIKVLANQERPKDPSKKWLAVRKSMFKEPQGIIHIKEVYNEKSIIKAVEIQINRMKVQNTPAMKTASYIYDKEARELVRNLILEFDFDLEQIKKYLKKNPLKDGRKKEYPSIKVAKFVEYAAKRVTLDNSFDHKKINKIPYAKSIIPALLHNHLYDYHKEVTKLERGFWENDDLALTKAQEKAIKDSANLAFSGEGLESLNKKFKYPISKVTIFEKKSPEDKFRNNYFEVDAGANVYFVMYENLKTGERKEMYSLATHKAIERLVQGLPIADVIEGYKTIILSPNQLVYLPTKEEQNNPELIDFQTKDKKKRKEIFSRVYKMVSCSDKECHFIPHFVSSSIISTTELGSNEKSEKAWDGKIEYLPNSKGKLSRKNSGTIIKQCCVKLKVDRLGNVSLT
jgi:CRISPR-associated endonuclease Csn1